MSDLNPDKQYIELGGKKYEAMFDINCMERLEEKYGTLKKFTEECYGADDKKAFDALRYIIAEMINESVLAWNEDCDKCEERKKISEFKVGTYIAPKDFYDIRENAMQILIDSLPKPKDIDTPSEE